ELAFDDAAGDFELALVLAALELALLVERARFGALELAARGLRNRVRVDDDDFVDGEARDLRDVRFDVGRELFAAVRVLRLGDDHHGLAAEAFLVAREGDDVAGPHARHFRAGPLEVLRVVVLAVDDDDVLGAAADVDGAVDQVAEVARAQPAVLADRLARLVGHLVVALHDARAADFDLADAPVRQGLARPSVDDPHAVLRERAAAADDLHDVGRV